MHFADRILERCLKLSSRLVVGLDPHWDKLPKALKRSDVAPAEIVSAYFGEVIDRTQDVAVAYKPQMAFFEQFGAAGYEVLANLLTRLRDRDIPVILDGKRNDIGSTASAYARAVFGDDILPPAFPSDAVTVNPYLGDDGILPFIKQADKGIFLLVKTSNPSGPQFQDLASDDGTLAEQVAATVKRLNADRLGQHGYGSVGAVVGATYPEHLQRLRAAMPHALFLLPGYGAQGGTGENLTAAFDSQGLGALVNSSRGICFPKDFDGKGFEAVREAAITARDDINGLLGHR